jgi:membrane carboxypeptidase/penicillin-binding protein
LARPAAVVVMNAILIKIFATALAMSQVTVQPDKIKTEFDPVRDREVVAQSLRDGCAHMRKAFDIEDINLDDLISTAMDDPKAIAGEVKAFKGVDFSDLFLSYREFCKGEKIANSPVDLGEVIAFYNKALADLPTDAKMKALKPSGAYQVMDGKGERYTEVFEAERRIWAPLAGIPDHVQKAFVAAEDKRFFQHKGVDERGIIRAFITNMAQPGRPQGGSTITQQVAKNLLVGDDVTYERKMREMVVASRLEQMLSKQDILELYLNAIYLGRGSWGVEMAARSYFGKSAKELSIGEGALLAGITKGPNFYNPERHPDRARERITYVLGRMQAESFITNDQMKSANGNPSTLVAYERIRRDSGFHFLDQVAREAKSLGIDPLNSGGMVVRSTIRPDLQRAAELALQDGLARYEANSGRARFLGPETNLAEAVAKIAEDKENKSVKPGWQQALEAARTPLYDVHWTPAIVLGAGRKGEGLRVGLADGRVLPLGGAGNMARRLQAYDVVFVRVNAKSARAELRVRPLVQGAAVVLDNNTGGILAVAGGFSYPLSQLNRATQSQRQPGSTLKPFSYLAALRKGVQPNTIVRDAPLTLPPINNAGRSGSSNIMVDPADKDYWTPKNYSGGGGGVTTLRRALENSKNLVTANLLDSVIDYPPEDSLTRVCELTQEAQVYKECVRYYPFVLGAQPARLVDLAAFYAAIATEGARPSPHVIDAVEQNGRAIYRNKSAPIWLGSADRVAFFQLKSMLQGVVARGTANAIKHLAPYVGGKTGTSDNENDAWFIGFSNEVTVGVWVGYDNADGKRRTLGGGMTGAKVAIPIFEPIMQAVWANYAPRTALSGPSLVAGRQMSAVPINLHSGDPVDGRGGGAFTEYLRLDSSGQVNDTQYQFVAREEAYGARDYAYGQDGDLYGPYANRDVYVPPGQFIPQGSIYQPRRGPLDFLFGNQPQYSQPQYVDPRQYEQREVNRQRQRRVDPDYFFGQGPSR